MEMPQPTPQHRRLEALVGRWSGEETLHPAPWAPELRTATGKFSIRMGVDGMFLITDYEQARDGAVVFRGHGVYGWDATKERYTMYWFDSMGMSPNQTLGVWTEDELIFSAQGDHGHARYVYTLRDPDRFAFRIESSPDGESWSPVMEGEYLRQPAE